MVERLKLISMSCLYAAFALAACGEPQDEVDFGAAIVARYYADAEHECAAMHFDDMVSCANAAARSKARLSARTANEALKTFNTNCAEDIGRSRCDELLWTAYGRIQSAEVAQSR